MTMDVGRMPAYHQHSGVGNGSSKKLIRTARRQRPGSGVVEIADTDKMSPSPPRSARVVKSLVSGSVLHLEIPSAAKKSKNQPGPNNYSCKHVVIDRGFQQSKDTKALKTQNQKKPTTTTSPSSFLKSIGACTGVGTMGSNFLNEHNEESRFEYKFDAGGDDNDSRRRRNFSCYSGNDEQEMEDLIVSFSRTSGLPMTKSRTSNTMNTTQDSVLVHNSRVNAIAEESIDGTGVGSSSHNSSIELNRLQPAHDAFSSARKLLFGVGGNATDNHLDRNHVSTTNKNKVSSSFRYNTQNNVLCNDSCLDKTRNNTLSRGTNETLLQYYTNTSPVSPSSGKSLIRSSFSPRKTMYAPAYDDEEHEVGTNIRNNLEEGFCYNLSNASANENKNDETAFFPASMVQSVGSYNTNTTANNTGGHREIQYWRQRLHYATKYYGKSHSSTADAYFNLGRAQLKLSGTNESSGDPYIAALTTKSPTATQQKHQYDLAVENLTIAHGIWERTHGPEHLAVGRALDALGLAIVTRAKHDRMNSGAKQTAAVEDELRYARRLLEDAFAIRVHHLGVWHVDTVETYNKLASVFLHLGQLPEAARAYKEVFLVRRAIFGRQHPSVAIAAHSLANCHYKKSNFEESLGWYKIALEVYETMGLSYRHPAVAKLLKDQSRLEKYMELEF